MMPSRAGLPSSTMRSSLFGAREGADGAIFRAEQRRSVERRSAADVHPPGGISKSVAARFDARRITVEEGETLTVRRCLKPTQQPDNETAQSLDAEIEIVLQRRGLMTGSAPPRTPARSVREVEDWQP